jgi:hypothetical protein
MPNYFKGPLFPSQKSRRLTAPFTDVTAVRGVVNETDYERSAYQRARFAAGRRPGKTFESMGIPSVWALGDEEDNKDA